MSDYNWMFLFSYLQQNKQAKKWKRNHSDCKFNTVGGIFMELPSLILSSMIGCTMSPVSKFHYLQHYFILIYYFVYVLDTTFIFMILCYLCNSFWKRILSFYSTMQFLSLRIILYSLGNSISNLLFTLS